MANFGFYILASCMVLSLYGSLASGLAGWTRNRRLWLSARMALTCTAVFAVIASGLMWYALFNRDFSLFYVFKNSSVDLPPMYTLTAFWSSLEGSHMLWTLLLCIVSCLGLWTFSKDNEHIMPSVSAVLQAVLTWMFYLSVTHSDLFQASPVIHENGRGMNALLQNPYMAIHPPLLFVGYTCTVMPFAYSLAALVFGEITEGWLKTVRRWTLVSWCFLTVSIILGGRWAYVELGWGGYWAWDPVENSSFLPWLFSTALLHTLYLQEKIGQLKKLGFVLAILAFFMTFFGTFITRSGVITSVHSFAESNIGPNYLAFLSVVLLGSLGLLFLRGHLVLPAKINKIWGVSKESVMVMGIVTILAMACIVIVGTVFPIITDALTKQRISVQAPYFNKFAPYFGLATVLLLALGNLMYFSKTQLPILVKLSSICALFAVPLSLGLCYRGEVFDYSHGGYLYTQVVGIYVLSWVGTMLSADFILKLKSLGWNWRLFLTHKISFIGAYVAHIGFLIMIFGFLGNYRGLEKEFTLNAGETQNHFGFDITLSESGMTATNDANATLFGAPIKVVDSRSGQTFDLKPARSKYPTSNDLLNEIGVDGTLWHDVYFVLKDFDRSTGKKVTLKFYLNFAVRFVWLATAIMFLGGLICLFDPMRGTRSKDVYYAT